MSAIGDPHAAIGALAPELVALRRQLHQQPELGFQEWQTAALVEERLGRLGLARVRRVTPTGVVGELEGGRPGPTLLLRADLDALPIQERSGAPYASRVDGVHHACGHDGHTAILLGVAQALAERAAALPGRVLLVFQPAEELPPGGAAAMLEAGLLEGPRPDAALALHLITDLPLGTIGVSDGAFMAGNDWFSVTLRGRGGHGAMPHQAVDAIAIAGQVLVALQTVVSRHLSPLESGVVTVGTLRGGTISNVIADEVRLDGTLRYLEPGIRDLLREQVTAIPRGIAAALGGEAEVEIRPFCPPVVNDPQLAALVRAAAAEVVGSERVVSGRRTMGGDDMGFILERVPGCYFWVGAAHPARGPARPHHHPSFDFDEEALAIGAETLLRASLRVLERGVA